MVTKNKFIAGSVRHSKFNQMVERIWEISGIDLKFIRQSGERMLNQWEERSHRDLKTLFHAKERSRQDEINKMVVSLQRSLEPKLEVANQKIILKKIETIARFWIEDLYFPV